MTRTGRRKKDWSQETCCQRADHPNNGRCYKHESTLTGCSNVFNRAVLDANQNILAGLECNHDHRLTTTT